MKGIGVAGKAIGNFIGSTPVIKNGNVDEWLLEKGALLEQNSEQVGQDTLKRFEAISDSGSALFLDHLGQINRVFNMTREIYIDQENVYLAAM